MTSFVQTGKYIAVLLVTLLAVFLYKSSQGGQSIGSGQNAVLSIPPHNALPSGKMPIHRFNVPAVQCDALQASKKKIRLALDDISLAWDIPSFPLFLTMMNIPQRSWDIQKVKFVEKIMSAHGRTHGNASAPFIVGFSGSSVTAGHDSFFYEAFPTVFYDVMAPVFASLGLNLIVRNHALGNNPCFAYDACIKTHIGEDLDMLTWEQSMNCGRTVKPLEAFARSGHAMKKQPTLLFLLSGTPSWEPSACNASNTMPTRTSAFTKEEEVLKNQDFRQIASSSTVSAKQLRGFPFLNDNHRKIADAFAHMAPMGQNVFPIESYKCMGPYNGNFSLKTPGGGAIWHPGKLAHKLRGDSLSYGVLSMLDDAIDAIQSTSCRAMSIGHNNVEDSSVIISSPSSSSDGININSIMYGSTSGKDEKNVSKRGGSHQSDARRLQQHQDGNSQSSVTVLVSSVLRALNLSSASAPSFHAGTNTNTNSHGHHKELVKVVSEELKQPRGESDRTSFVLYSIVSQYLEQLSLIEAPPVPAIYDLKELESIGSSQCYTDLLPRLKNSLADQLIRCASDGKQTTGGAAVGVRIEDDERWYGSLNGVTWTRNLSFADANAVLKSEKAGRGYVDKKYVFYSTGVGSSISLPIKTTGTNNNPIWICEVQKGFSKYPDTMTDLDMGADIYVHIDRDSISDSDVCHSSSSVPLQQHNKHHNHNATSNMMKLDLKLLSDQCYRTIQKVPPGRHLLTIVQNSDKLINVAYIITW